MYLAGALRPGELRLWDAANVFLGQLHLPLY